MSPLRCLVCFLALPLVGRAVEPDHWIGGIAGVVVGGLVYVSLMWRSRTELGLDQLVKSRRRTGRRRAVPVKPGRHSSRSSAHSSAPPSAQTTDPPPSP